MIALLLAAATLPPATELMRLSARDAGQGVAADRRHVYAIDNHSISRIEVTTRREVARWDGDPALFPHLNSCAVAGRELLCAGSNYPALPMTSRIERFDRKTLEHLGTWPLSESGGSLTWAFCRKGSWWAGFANYDGKGGAPGRDHRATMLVRYDRDWREKGRWRFPESVLARMAPRSASGGVPGKHGLIYVTGHDRPELYLLRVPKAGDVLEHIATVPIATGGQAIALDPADRDRLWSLERKTRQLVASHLPPLRELPR